MHKDQFKSPLTVDQAIEAISANHTIGFMWYPVKNKKGCIFEIGGRNMISLELMAYIPQYEEDGSIQFLANGYSNSNYSFNASEVSFPDRRATFNPSLTYEQLLDYMKNTDFRKSQFKIKTSIIYSEPVYHHEIILKKNAKENKS